MTNTDRPNITVERTELGRLLDWLSLAGVVLFVLYIIYQFGKLPDEVPTHFNHAGEADAWSGKGTLFILPAIAVGLYIMLTLLNRSPHIFNYPVKITEQNAPMQYRLGQDLVSMLNFVIIYGFLLY